MSDDNVTLVLDPTMLSRLKHFVGYMAFSGAGNRDAAALYEEVMRQCREEQA